MKRPGADIRGDGSFPGFESQSGCRAELPSASAEPSRVGGVFCGPPCAADPRLSAFRRGCHGLSKRDAAHVSRSDSRFQSLLNCCGCVVYVVGWPWLRILRSRTKSPPGKKKASQFCLGAASRQPPAASRQPPAASRLSTAWSAASVPTRSPSQSPPRHRDPWGRSRSLRQAECSSSTHPRRRA
jgi:hypothetical protein